MPGTPKHQLTSHSQMALTFHALDSIIFGILMFPGIFLAPKHHILKGGKHF